MMSRCEYNAALYPSQEMELITVYKDRDLKCDLVIAIKAESSLIKEF